jgi:hypothetical protein
VQKNPNQNRVLEHIGKVAGVKGVAIIHARNSWTQIHRCPRPSGDVVAATSGASAWI